MRLEWLDSLDSIRGGTWNSLVEVGSPSMRWEWLSVLERNALRTGQDWVPHHALVYEGSRLLAAAPFWWRADSMGDFVFDQGFAQAAQIYRERWYPKLVGTVPFTAASGWRVLHQHNREGYQALRLVLESAREEARREGTGVHLLWLDPGWRVRPEVRHLLEVILGKVWVHPHFLWKRGNLGSFEEFLSHFGKNRRRNIRREMASAQEQELRVVTLRASEAPATWHRTMAVYYQTTNDHFGPWAARFLDQEFFEDASRRAGNLVWYTAALKEGQEVPEAMGFLLSDGIHWIGRYWGAARFYENLHFHLCYYEPLRFLLESGGASFDPGMGGPHKVHRGFRPFPAESWHWCAHRVGRLLLERNLPLFNQSAVAEMEELEKKL